MKISLESRRSKVIAIIIAVVIVVALVITSVLLGKFKSKENSSSDISGTTTNVPKDDPLAKDPPSDDPPIVTPPELKKITGVTAEHAVFDYDGASHSITVKNTLDSDKVFFSTSSDGPWQSDTISYNVEGEYRIYFKVVRAEHEDFIGFGDLSIVRRVLVGISTCGKTVVYDGEVHNIDVLGTTADDTVTYSIDRVNFNALPELTEVGEYEVYCRVDRRNGGYFRGSATLVILPDIYGTYVGIDRIITIDETVTFDVNGVGKIDGDPFDVDGAQMEYDGKIYTRLTAEQAIYKFTFNGIDRYIAAARTISVAIDTEHSKIMINGDELDIDLVFNYIENIIVGEAEIDRAMFNVEANGEITVVEITLSEREIYTPTETVYSVKYDGNSHEVKCDYDGEVWFVVDGSPTKTAPIVTEIGKYEYTVRIENDKYLPTETTVRVTVVLGGCYFAENGILDFGTLEPDYSAMTLNGKPIESADGEVVYDGVRYKKQGEKTLLVLTVMGVTKVVEPTIDITKAWLTIEIDMGGVRLVNDKDSSVLAEVETEIADPKNVSATANGKPATMVKDTVYLTPSELATSLSYVVVEIVEKK